MKIIKGNIWTYYDTGHRPICITTNGICKKDNTLVMGKGIALDAALRFPDLSMILGRNVKLYGNVPFYIRGYNLISFPTKQHWQDDSIVNLILNSATKIKLIKQLYNIQNIWSPWPGCGNGGLKPEHIKNQLELIWDSDEFVIVEK